MELNEHYKRYDYGYNLTPFEYPIQRDPDLQAKFVNRMKGHFNILGSLKPDFVKMDLDLMILRTGWYKQI